MYKMLLDLAIETIDGKIKNFTKNHLKNCGDYKSSLFDGLYNYEAKKIFEREGKLNLVYYIVDTSNVNSFENGFSKVSNSKTSRGFLFQSEKDNREDIYFDEDDADSDCDDLFIINKNEEYLLFYAYIKETNTLYRLDFISCSLLKNNIEIIEQGRQVELQKVKEFLIKIFSAYIREKLIKSWTKKTFKKKYNLPDNKGGLFHVADIYSPISANLKTITS